MNKLCVSKLPETITEDDISLIFSVFGDIKSLKLLTTTAFVEYTMEDDAKKALEAMDGRRLYNGEEPISIGYAYDKNKRIIVTKLPRGVTKAEVRKYFGFYGNILNLEIENGALQSVAKIDFKHASDGRKVLELDGKIKFEGQLLAIATKQTQNFENADEKCVFVYNLPNNYGEDEFCDLFGKYGPIKSAGIVSGNKGYVNYDNEVSALKAFRYLEGKKVRSKKLRVVLKTMKNKR